MRISPGSPYTAIPLESEYVLMLLASHRRAGGHLDRIDECIEEGTMTLHWTGGDVRVFDGEAIISPITGYNQRGIAADGEESCPFLGDHLAAAGFYAFRTRDRILVVHSGSLESA